MNKDLILPFHLLSGLIRASSSISSHGPVGADSRTLSRIDNASFLRFQEHSHKSNSLELLDVTFL